MSYIKDYLEFVHLNEAHENYHLWSCFATLASLAERRVWVTRAYQKIYPNMYIVMVGPQGNRKTAAKDIAQDILRDVGDTQFSCESTTREDLIDKMEQNEHTFMYDGVLQSYLPMMICVTELKEFLSVDPGRMINFLTAVYDSNFFDYGTRHRGTNVLLNPCLNMLACETPDWLTERLKDKIVSGGFSRRVLYVYETEHQRIVVEQLPKACIEARKRCIERGKKVKQVSGEFTWEPEAKNFFNDWYLKLDIPEEKSMKGYFESKHTLLLKVAMLISLSEEDSLIIRVGHLELGLTYLSLVEENMPMVFIGGGRNELATASGRVIEKLKKAKRPVRESEIKTMLWGDCRNTLEMNEVIEQTVRAGKVKRLRPKEGKGEAVLIHIDFWEPSTEKLPNASQPSEKLSVEKELGLDSLADPPSLP